MSNPTELLKRALEHLDLAYKHGKDLDKDIRAFLAAEPEAEEPVAWIQPNHLDKAQFMPFLCRVEPKQRDDFIPLYTRPEPEAEPVAWFEYAEHADAWFLSYRYNPNAKTKPLYLHPPRPEPARKPMTEEKIDEELETNEHYCAKSFADGVRWAEKHHGIGINPSDPDSIDLQSRCRGDKL